MVIVNPDQFGGTGAFASRKVRRLRHMVTSLCAVVVFLSTGNKVRAGEPALPEHQVKAAFLVSFPKYVDWAAEAFAETNSPIVIAVLGESKVVEEIQKLIAGKSVNGREIILKRLTSGEEPGVCHILFISATEQQRAPNLLAKLKNASILTVGESDDFLDNGGVINLARRDRKIALEVNLTAANKSRIKISSRLLGVASVVKGQSK
jgi:hypothetical protein